MPFLGFSRTCISKVSSINQLKLCMMVVYTGMKGYAKNLVGLDIVHVSRAVSKWLIYEKSENVHRSF